MAKKEITAKVPLFDRIFKPEIITLSNGHTVERPRTRMYLISGVILIAFVISMKVTGFDFGILITRGHELTVILSQIFQPKWSYIDKVIPPLLDTIKMSILGTLVGCLLGLVFAIIASSNINSNKFTLVLVRLILAILRSVPTIVIASIFALVFGLGTFAGTVAITLFTLGIVAKMLYESIETIDMKPFEAMISMGCNQFRAFWAACMPQILPTYLSHSLYCFEINIRAASILGWVGAGGLGILINERIGWRDYNGLGMVLIALFVLVLCIDQLSDYLRGKLS